MPTRTILITGANRGIGFAILQALATRTPSDHYLLGARTLENGTAAIKQLRELGVTSQIDVVELDVTSDDSVRAAEAEIRTKYQRLDILINNAGIALIPAPDSSDLRATYNTILNTNVSSIALTTSVFLPLLASTSPSPRVLNVSSARASLAMLTSGKLPPTVSVPYSISKVALNALTLEYARANTEVWFGVVSPGHCKTAFNGYRGTKDPVDGARVVVELVGAEKGRYETGGFWQVEGEEREPTAVAW